MLCRHADGGLRGGYAGGCRNRAGQASQRTARIGQRGDRQSGGLGNSGTPWRRMRAGLGGGYLRQSKHSLRQRAVASGHQTQRGA